MNVFVYLTILLTITVYASAAATATPEQLSARRQAVLGLSPAGYWPLDDGGGSQLRDIAAGQNHARSFNVPFTASLLDYSSAYQFVEIPGSSAYFGDEFTIAVWVFSRRASYEREGVAVVGSWPREPLPVSLRLSGAGTLGVEIVSDGTMDALGSVAAGIAISANVWRHLAYTFKGGTGKLYVDGALAHAKDSVPYSPAREAHPVLAGYDADWWGVHPASSQSLDGSLCHFALFDRVLTDVELNDLYGATMPQETPHVQAMDEIRIKGRFVRIEDLGEQTLSVQRQSLDALLPLLRANENGERDRIAAIIRPYLAGALRIAPLRFHAVMLSQELQDFESLHAAAPMLADIAANRGAPPEERASAALALGAMGGRALAQVETLLAALEADLGVNPPRIPVVSDVVRNALIYALIRIQPDHPPVRELLGRAYAKPILDLLDLEQPYLAETRGIVSDGRYMDALGAAKGLLDNNGVHFLSQNDPYRDKRGDIHDRSYTSMAEYDGYTYKFGEGKSFAGCEPISRADYDKALAHHATTHPEARLWLDGDVNLMRRANLQKIAPDGSVETTYIGGEHFLFSANDEKVCSWAVAVDRLGYIHVLGGQHNAPDYTNFMPGSWEDLGLFPESDSPAHPTKMYWVSTRPGDISAFEFVGLNNNPRDVPIAYFNYMNFVQDNNGELYLYGRTDGWGFQSWGLFKYHTELQRWSPVGGAAGGVIDSAKANEPRWMHFLYKQYRGGIPDGSGPILLAWAWQPHFYNYIRSTRGVQFDPENRMIVQVGIRGIDENAWYADNELFAYSEDGGQTFRRADGSELRLPLTANPAPEHNAEVEAGMNGLWLMQWKFNLALAGLGA